MAERKRATSNPETAARRTGTNRQPRTREGTRARRKRDAVRQATPVDQPATLNEGQRQDPGQIASESEAQAVSSQVADRPATEVHDAAVRKVAARKPRRQTSRAATQRARAAGLPAGTLQPAKGDMVWLDSNGRRHEPIACGIHRSVPVETRGNDDPPGTAPGFQPSCPECAAEFASSVESARRVASEPVNV